ncbi:MAG: hypothetical protein HOH19_02535 [Kordiimonadaceae bacterium]|nr:hypothetical protein [Kordiimonadaceae bacterium]MBT6031425.1 hypothetical protein [Kordiimonadaceae bacterium]
MINTYPPSKYPKIYPKVGNDDPELKTRKAMQNYKNMNILTFILGFVLIIMAIYTDYSPKGEGEETFVVFYAMIQFFPLFLMELSEFKHLKRMRQANLKTTRTAVLKPRRFFNFISPFAFSLAVIMLTASISYDLYVNEFILEWNNDIVIRIFTLTIVHVYFAVLVIWHMYGRKKDPHQASKDRDNYVKTIVRTVVYTSIGISLFLIVDIAVDEYNVSYLDPVIMSVYFQLLAVFGIGTLLRSSDLKTIDFDVYKEDAPI